MNIRQACVAMLAALGLATGAPGASQAQDGAVPARAGTPMPQAPAEGELTRPDIERWIFVGATVDHGVVPEDGTRKFSAEDPGKILVTQMEPGAYDYFMEHGRYADGTTFATSIYMPHENPKPAMDGVVQGDLAILFVHRLERGETGLQHEFSLFGNGPGMAKRMPEGSECVACHTKHGGLDGTYVQFYPSLRERLRVGVPDAAAATIHAGRRRDR